jgi:membrane protein implicated in regulation of membrane protease activity
VECTSDEVTVPGGFAVRLNALAMVLAGLLLLFGGWPFLGVFAVLVVYGAVSFAHARAMRRCAELLAEDRRLREQVQRGPVVLRPNRHEQQLAC